MLLGKIFEKYISKPKFHMDIRDIFFGGKNFFKKMLLKIFEFFSHISMEFLKQVQFFSTIIQHLLI